MALSEESIAVVDWTLLPIRNRYITAFLAIVTPFRTRLYIAPGAALTAFLLSKVGQLLSLVIYTYDFNGLIAYLLTGISHRLIS